MKKEERAKVKKHYESQITEEAFIRANEDDCIEIYCAQQDIANVDPAKSVFVFPVFVIKLKGMAMLKDCPKPYLFNIRVDNGT